MSLQISIFPEKVDGSWILRLSNKVGGVLGHVRVKYLGMGLSFDFWSEAKSEIDGRKIGKNEVKSARPRSCPTLLDPILPYFLPIFDRRFQISATGPNQNLFPFRDILLGHAQ